MTSPPWAEAVQEELGRITGSHCVKKRNTILALVEARMSPDLHVKDVWSRPDVCSQNTFYSKWNKDPLFAKVLANVQRLAAEWHTAEEARLLKERQEEWRERMYELADKGLQKLERMLNFPLQRTVVEESVSEDGKRLYQTIIEPAGWTWANVPPLMATLDKHGRLALDMTTDKTEQAVTGDEERPITHKFDLSNVPLEILHGLATRDGPPPAEKDDDEQQADDDHDRHADAAG